MQLYITICHDTPYSISEVSKFIKHKFLLKLAMEFSDRIMLVSTYRYSLAAMTYHVKTIYVIIMIFCGSPLMATYCTHTHHTHHTLPLPEISTTAQPGSSVLSVTATDRDSGNFGLVSVPIQYMPKVPVRNATSS